MVKDIKIKTNEDGEVEIIIEIEQPTEKKPIRIRTDFN